MIEDDELRRLLSAADVLYESVEYTIANSNYIESRRHLEQCCHDYRLARYKYDTAKAKEASCEKS